MSKITSRKVRMSKYSAKSLNSKSYYSSKKIQQELEIDFEKINKVIKKVCKNYLI
jgi:biotin operon repressor